MFDNILITHNKEVADAFAAKTWAVKYKKEVEKYKEDFEQKNKVDKFEAVTLAIAQYPVAAFLTIVAVLFPLFFCCPVIGGAKKAKVQ